MTLRQLLALGVTGGIVPCPAALVVLLSAVALMAAGWDGAPKVDAPGFPQDGRWRVKWEGLQPMP